MGENEMQNWEQELINTANNYNVITFDVFDTLLIRDVPQPTDVFWLVGGEKFRYRRILAELLANISSKSDEITIDDIYKYLPQRYLQQEIKMEKAVCRANPPMYRVYQKLKEDGKRIFAVSDMYLDKSVVNELLCDAGYSFDGVYVSSEYGVRKRSGKLFDLFCEKEEINKKEILHIGDNPQADGKGSEIAGIPSFLVPNVKNNLKYSGINKRLFYLKHDEKKKRVLQMRSHINHGLAEIDNHYEKLGYEILGPILVSFVQWIHSRKTEYEFSKLFFLARDMKIVYDIYRDYYEQDDCAYFYVSRVAIRNMSRGSDNSFVEYMKKMGCFGNIAIVDAGWKGFTQKVLQEYAKQIDPQSDIGGLYIGKSYGMKLFEPFRRTEACFIRKGRKYIQAPLYCGLIESFIGSNEEQVINYGEGGEPIFNPTVRRNEKFDDIQCGAMRFAKEWKEKGNAEIDTKEVFEAYYHIFDKPLMEDMQLLGEYETDHFDTSKLIVFHSRKYYRKHWREWFSDLQLSTWKGAFFRMSFTHYKLIYNLYKFADSLLIMLLYRKKLKGKSIQELIGDYS